MFKSEKNPTKRGIKWGIFSISLCHTIETRKTNVNIESKTESLHTDLLHTDVVQLIRMAPYNLCVLLEVSRSHV